MRLMLTGDIAAHLGVSRQYVQKLVGRRDFPKPLGVAGDVRVWRAADVERWAAKHRPSP